MRVIFNDALVRLLIKNLKMNVINDLKELPKGSFVNIYGAGSFGMMLYDSIV
jgi:hypothetical protein